MKKESWDRVCVDIVKRLAQHTDEYVTSISLEVSPTEGRLVGSGTYISLQGKPYLLTNEHVARFARQGNLGHVLKRGEYVFCISNPFQCLEYPVDAAVARIEKQQFLQGDRKAVPAGRIKKAFVTAQHELLLVHGFPGVKSRMSALAGGLISGSVPYLTQEMPLPEEYDCEYFFAIHYPYDKPLQTTEDRRECLPDPHGLSGSVVWDTGYVAKQGQNWTIEDASVVGLIRVWDQNNHALIGVKIEVIREFLLLALRREAAYFHWLEREQPDGDDWTDWFFAENSINDII